MRFCLIGDTLIPENLLSSPLETFPISKLETLPQKPLNPHFLIDSNLQNMLSGKQLPLSDLSFPLQTIQAHYENGCLEYRKSIIIEQGKPRCVRCGNQKSHLFASFSCSRCGEICTYCRNCIMMGRMSICTPLLSWTGAPPPSAEARAPSISQPLQWSGTLSPGQRVASDGVIEAIEQEDSLLVWAVCGSGKTEVLFEGINAALQEGKRICIATPRSDVVLELAPRLKKVFPNTRIAALYGGSEDRHLFAPLTIATTHQLLRFYKAFDVLILDEVDAFPYCVDESLQYAVTQASKPVSSQVYLTATPNEQWQKECRIGKRKVVKIPARFHRHPLPVPRFQWCGNWRKRLKKENLPPNVLLWIKKRMQMEKQVLLFFPQIQLMEQILPILQNIHPQIEAVHSEDPKRKEKVQRMREREIPILLTTTILERGVTFSNLDVAVFGAEDRIFTESALVQIAGRVGRKAEYPNGDIMFFHFGKTNAMVKARKQIITMNKEAKQKGLIDEPNTSTIAPT